MQAHGYLLPAYSSALVTREYLDGVRAKEYYCPHKQDNIPKLEVPNPPPKMELLKLWKQAVHEKVIEEPNMDAKWNRILATLELIEYEGKLPDNDWLITVLSDVPGDTCIIF